jgi:uncharacterized protein involved in response to NO
VVPFAGGGSGGGSLALFHSVAQIQGFLTCFVAGFLLTLVPRHTRTGPAASWEVVSALALPAVAVLCAWGGESALASWLWLVLVGIVMAFTLNRIRGRQGAARLPPVLLWVPASLGAGAIGAVLVAGGPWFAIRGALEVWAIGRGLLVQGFVTGLVLGIGGFLLPEVTRGERVPEPLASQRRRGLALHGAAALAFFGSFAIEPLVGARAGFALRALVAAGVLIGVARIHRLPALPGVHRWLMWLAAWLVPLAFLLGAAAPRFRGAALHVLFVGGFAQITLAVSTHLVLSRDAARTATARSPLRVMAALLAAAFGARIVASIDLARVAEWLGVAAYAFCAALAAWGVVVGPALLARKAAGAATPAPRRS